MIMSSRHLHAALLVANFLAIAILVAAPAAAKDTPDLTEKYNIGSTASEFLQSKTRMSVLEREDKADPACQEKHFIKAEPVGPTDSRDIGGITERKWREIWTLTRCGTNFYYMIFFTEVGIGGAYYAILGPQTTGDFGKGAAVQTAAAPASRDFFVYFDSRKASIRPDAAVILASVVDAAKQLAVPKVILKGHADTVGSVAFNQKLSEERALSVKEYLAKHGLAVTNVATIGVGKTDLKVPTADQVREQANRNVHIELK